jgi:dTDP-4-amino-4,6-dideoxygalactose transaminase
MIEYESLGSANREFVDEFREAFENVISAGWYILGNEVRAFEDEFAVYIGSRFCVGVANGLDALTLSMRALDLPERSEILVASNTYIATIIAILNAGHVPVLVEPDSRTYNLAPRLMAASISEKTKAVCVTHLYGKPCRMDQICDLAGERGLKVIEDCAQSHGALLKGRSTGTFGQLGCFSFYPTKNLGALGDAGAITTDDPNLADRLRHLRNYGSLQKYVNVYLGVNSRLDELQAAFLRMKLKHLSKITEHKRNLAEIYFQNLPRSLILPFREEDTFDVFHIFPVRCERRDELRAYLLDNHIKTEVHYPIPPHRQEAMRGILSGDYPISDEIHRTELSLPISYGTTRENATEVCRVIRRFFEK